jgi:hypothetical protein
MEHAERGDIFIGNVFTFSGLHGVISQQTEFFIITAV